MNLSKILVLVFLIYSDKIVLAQQDGYCFLISKGDSNLYNSNYEKSIEYYRLAFDCYKDSIAIRDVARSIRPAFFLGDSMHIRRSSGLILAGDFHLDADTYSEIMKIKNDTLCRGIAGYSEWNKIVKLYSDSAIRKNVHYNSDLSRILEEVFDKDQEPRLVLDSIYRSGGFEKNQRVVDSISARVQLNDSSNLVLVSSILDKYGWLGLEQVGHKANTALFSVIQHADLNPNAQIKYLPLLEAAVMRGKARGQYLAMLKDRISIRECGYQMYGTQVVFDAATGSVSPKPLFSETEVDVFRASVGLPPIRYYLTLFTRKK